VAETYDTNDTSFQQDDTDLDAAGHWSYFRLRSPPTLVTSPIGGVKLAAARLRMQEPHYGPTEAPAPESSFRVSVAMRPMRLKALWAEDRWVSRLDHDLHSIGIFDMERRPRVEFVDPFELVQFYVPQAALRQFAREHSLRPVEGLRLPEPGSFDPVIAHLACSLMPALAGGTEVSGLFVDHVHLALLAHLLGKYAELKSRDRQRGESLAPCQQRRVIELLDANLSSDITLAELAREFDFSMAHFARAFKNSVGVSPHAWLTRRRIERAKRLLTHTPMTLTEIALECGFSHRISLARAFVRVAGVKPSEWRRQTRR
jgi:AraC family transcriptional regulator